MLIPFRWLLFQVLVTITGVAASPAIGLFQIDVSSTSSGVAANPQIGIGTVTEEDVVNLTGVAADPQVGTGTVQIEGEIVPSQQIFFGNALRKLAEERARQRQAAAREELLRKPIKLLLSTYVVTVGVTADARVGHGTFGVQVSLASVSDPREFSVVNDDFVTDVVLRYENLPTQIDLSDEELAMILEEIYAS